MSVPTSRPRHCGPAGKAQWLSSALGFFGRCWELQVSMATRLLHHYSPAAVVRLVFGQALRQPNSDSTHCYACQNPHSKLFLLQEDDHILIKTGASSVRFFNLESIVFTSRQCVVKGSFKESKQINCSTFISGFHAYLVLIKGKTLNILWFQIPKSDTLLLWDKCIFCQLFLLKKVWILALMPLKKCLWRIFEVSE